MTSQALWRSRLWCNNALELERQSTVHSSSLQTKYKYHVKCGQRRPRSLQAVKPDRYNFCVHDKMHFEGIYWLFVDLSAKNRHTGSGELTVGVLLDCDLTLSPYITNICEAANFHLFRLSRIRKYMTPDTLKMAVHSLVSSKMDYCNSLLIGLPKVHLNHLQHVMNFAARLVSGVGKSEHITSVLKCLHWLPV